MKPAGLCLFLQHSINRAEQEIALNAPSVNEHSYRKSQFLMRKLTFSTMFNSYVSHYQRVGVVGSSKSRDATSGRLRRNSASEGTMMTLGQKPAAFSWDPVPLIVVVSVVSVYAWGWVYVYIYIYTSIYYVCI